jgi:hypothetical protein
MSTSSSYVFINSALRNIYEYPNSADFLIEGRQTENWNLIRSSSPKMPIQRSQNQYYNLKMCSLSLPMKPEILKYPGVFVSLESDEVNKNDRYRINHILHIDESGFPCENGRTPSEIAAALGKTVGELTPEDYRQARLQDSRCFYNSKTKCINTTTFWMTCDKLQFNEQGEAMWIQYKSCMDQALPLNWRGHAIRFKVLDPYGRVIDLSGTCPKLDPCEGNESTNQVYALMEVTYLPINSPITYEKDV